MRLKLLNIILPLIVWTIHSSNALISKIYDDTYLTSQLDDRFPYLRLENGSYIGPRDYFNLRNVFEPTREYLNNVNIEELLYDELRAMELSASIATMDQWYHSDPNEEMEINSNRDLCIRQLDTIYQELTLAEKNTSHLFTKGERNIDWLKYIDAWARPPSETYHGHSYWVGSYRVCLRSKLQLDGELTRFRYCWLKLKPESWPAKDIMVPKTSIRAGVCLPRVCDTRIANENQTREKIKQILHFNFSPLHRARFNQTIHVYCLPDQDRELSLSAKIFLACIACWLSIIGLVSVFAVYKQGGLSRFWLSLSIQENWARFVADDEPKMLNKQGQVDLRPIGVVKFFICILIILGHGSCSFGWVYNSSTFNKIAWRGLFHHYLPSSFKANDIFLVLGGLLSAYMISNKFKQPSLLLRPKIYLFTVLARYLRVAPTMVLILAFIKALYPQLADSPNWDYGTYKYSLQGQCQRSSWWRILGFPILFGYKGQSYYNECLSVSWYLIADMKIFFILPPLLYLMSKWSDRPKFAALVLIAPLVLISAAWQYKDLSMQQLVYFSQYFHYGHLFAMNILTLSFGELGYFSALNRMHAVVVGSFAGVRLYKFKKQQEKGLKPKWPFWMRGWFFATMIVWQIVDFFLPYYASYIYLKTGKVPASDESIKMSLVVKPRLDAIMFAIMSLRLSTDLAPSIMKYTKPLYKLSKLSYCILLVHTIVLAYVYTAHERTRLDSILLQFFVATTFVIVMSFIISFPVHLLVESPMALLVGSILESARQHQQASNVRDRQAEIDQQAVRGLSTSDKSKLN